MECDRSNLWIGIGCKRGTSAIEIGMAIDAVFLKYDLCQDSIAGIATIDLKLDEVGLLEYCRVKNLKSIGYSAELLNSIDLNQSENLVKDLVGTASVAEAAALLAAKTDRLTVPKQKFNFDTGTAIVIAIARYSALNNVNSG